MSKCLRHLKVKHYVGVNGLVGVDYHIEYTDAWCNGECDNCKSKFVCFTTGNGEFISIDVERLDDVSIDIGYRYG